MENTEWERFFELLDKITELPGNLKSKIKLVQEKADENGEVAIQALQEFTSWNFE